MIEEMDAEYSVLFDEANELIQEFSTSLKIDKYNLDDEVATHSEYYWKVAEMQTKTHGLFHRAQLMVKELEAELAGDVRKNPDEYEIVKLTENQVTETIERDDEVKNARRLRQKTEELNGRMFALLNAYDHRRSMINNEVQLQLSGMASVERNTKVANMEKEVKRKTIRRRKKLNEKD